MGESMQKKTLYSPSSPRTQDLPDLPEGDSVAQEWKTYNRQVARLLAEGWLGKFALVKEEVIVSIWDTQRDTLQAGQERFGQEPFLVQEIQPVLRPRRDGYRRLCWD
jgi:hypothetical protein